MSDTKFYAVPFANTGDIAPIPNDSQLTGEVSYEDGFTGDYELGPSDPDYKPVPRDQTNQLYRDITANLRRWQLQGVPQWVLAAQNGGVAVPYEINAKVRHNDVVYVSLVAANVATPGTDPAQWAVSEPFSLAVRVASQAITNAAASLVTFLTPGRASVAIREGRWTYAGAAVLTGANYVVTLPGAAIAQVAGATLKFQAPGVSPAGPFTLQVNGLTPLPLQTSSEGTIQAGDLQPGRIYTVECTGAKWMLVTPVASERGGMAPGTPFYFAGAAAPAGALAADGSAVSRTTYAALFAVIGTSYGVGDGSTTFNLPDDRGIFYRGWSNGGTFDPGRALGSFQFDALGAHSHTVTPPTANGFGGQGFTTTGSDASGEQVNPYATGTTGGDETTVKNRAYLACIKF